MDLYLSTPFNFSTYLFVILLMIQYVFYWQLKKYKTYKQYLKQKQKSKYDEYNIPDNQEYSLFLYNNSIFSFLDQNLINKFELDDRSQENTEQELPLPVIHSSKLADESNNNEQITKRNVEEASNEIGTQSSQVNSKVNRQIQVQQENNASHMIETSSQQIESRLNQQQAATNNQQESQSLSSDDDYDEDDDEEDDYESYNDDENFQEDKENPKGKKIRYLKKKPLLTGLQTFFIYWAFNVFSMPLYCLILIIRDNCTTQSVWIILSILSLIPSFTNTHSIIFFACIVQNQGIFLKLKDEQQMSESKIKSNYNKNDDLSNGNSISNNSSNNIGSKNRMNSNFFESERKIFVEHSLKRAEITSLVFTFIQLGILIYCFCQGEYDPKFIMMNPLLILIKSINYLHISFTKQLSYSNQKIQTQRILYQYYANFYPKNFDLKGIYNEFTKSKSLQNEQNNLEEFKKFLESKAYLAIQDFKQKEAYIENQQLKDIISNQGLKAQLEFQLLSSILLSILPFALLVISFISTLSLIQQDSQKNFKYLNIQDYYSRSYTNINISYLLNENTDNGCSVIFNVVIILEYLILLRIHNLIKKKVVLNTTKDPKKYD
ncbi:transmembrane protein, putative (macronuclear) [Tetrahymena thermophila SB210]|uniref:Transmembrane protein, putative n=1 Tax=Tetrahymena thermophila (strain SB210) TaxID=312017 RepID=Q24HV9_TETTS|nr:transmembrane protein, putative [Tetrahymena thermophila SB210]EAS07479.1 transmembrane protein, putative [Tetrahymena thermophila SB210]|eukprot:XP_001027721.1 transmembrane protein, putative [Tetrahymena thermophila SB210]